MIRKILLMLVMLLAASFHAGAVNDMELVIVHSDEIPGLPSGSIVRPYTNIPYASVILPYSEVVFDHDYKPDRKLDAFLAESLPIIRQAQAEANGATGEGRTVAIVDSGVDGAHADIDVYSEACFSTNVIHPVLGQILDSFCPGGQDEEVGIGTGVPCTDLPGGDVCEHGTHVAGISSAVAPRSQVVAIQVFHKNTFSSTNPKIQVLESDVIRALDWLVTNGAGLNVKAINLSLGGGSSHINDCVGWSPSMDSVVAALNAQNIQVVAASGNLGNDNGQGFPACAPGVVSVTATNDFDAFWSSSNVAPSTDLAAPGADITAPVPGGLYGTKSGTSMATPHVAGAVAAISTIANLYATGENIVTAMQLRGVPIVGTVNTVPRIDMEAGSEVFLLPDTDGDGWGDTQDNCTLVANGFGPLVQRDTNDDGYGNICDPDLNNDGNVNFTDMGIMHVYWGTNDPDSDLDGSGLVDQPDLDIMRAMFYGPPGPSGIAP